MNVTQVKKFSNISGNQGPFTLLGGRFNALAVATFAGSDTISLQQLGPDGTTWLTVPAYGGGNAAGLAVLAANGVMNVDLAPGTYQFALTSGVSAAYIVIASVPV